MTNTFFVSMELKETADLLESKILRGSISGVLLDRHGVMAAQRLIVEVLVFEKHYMRAGGRLTLTVVLDNLEGTTRVHFVSGGGGDAVMRFDWGASKNFAGAVETVLEEYRM